MSGRPYFQIVKKNHNENPRGWCDSNYFCSPSNREGTDVEPGVKDQKCIPIHMKSQGGRKEKKNKKKRQRKRKRKRRKKKRKETSRKTKRKHRKTKNVNQEDVNY